MGESSVGPHPMTMTSKYDAIIVGGGVSGSFIAHELTKSGMKCLMLEAGRHFSRDTYPRTELDSNGQLYWGGGDFPFYGGYTNSFTCGG